MKLWWREVVMPSKEQIDWSECPLVEVKPGVQSGAPVLRGMRMPVNAIVDNFDYGVTSRKSRNNSKFRLSASKRL
jgi:uncharacterized protein (DUF433 family)